MRDLVEEAPEIGSELAFEKPPPETPEQKAYRLSTEWIQRRARDTVKLHLDGRPNSLV